MHTQSGKIIVVSELYYPEETSTGYFITKIAEGLAEKFSVTVLCVQPTYSLRGVRAPKYEYLNGVDVHRCMATALNKDKLLFKLVNALTISFSIFFHLLLRLSSKDRVLVVTNPPLLPYLTAFACLIRRAGYFLLVHDVYPDALVAARIIPPGSILARIGGWLSNKLYRCSDQIIVLGRDMRELILKRIGTANADKIAIISNWSDIKDVFPLPRVDNPLLARMKFTEKWVLLYAGNMGRTHGLENIVQAAKKINSLDDTIQFVLCGSGVKWSWLEATVKKEGIPNITLLPSQPRSELNHLLNACDIALISFMPGMAGVSVPSRMYNVLAAGKPIMAVADPHSELALVVAEEGIGWVVSPEQPKSIVEAIIQAKTDRQRLAVMGHKARAVAEEKYTLRHAVNAYQELFDNE